MLSDLNIHLTRATADIHGGGPRPDPATSGEPLGWRAAPIIALRLARTEDDRAVADLARLDDTRPLTGPVLLAVVDGRPVAAGSLDDGRVVADPFVPTAEAVALLHVRMASLRGGAEPVRRSWRDWLPRRVRPAW